MISIDSQTLSAELYAEILLVLDSRQAVSNTRDRLGYYFQAYGVTIAASTGGRSNIFLGSDLCS